MEVSLVIGYTYMFMLVTVTLTSKAFFETT